MDKIECSIYELRSDFQAKHQEQQQYKEAVMRFMTLFSDGSSNTHMVIL